MVDVDSVGERQIQTALRDAAAVARLFVARLSAAAALVNGNLGIRVDELQKVGRNGSRLAEPRPLSVDFDAKGAEIARLAEIEAAQRRPAIDLAAVRHDQQRRPFPGAENVLANERARVRYPPMARRCVSELGASTWAPSSTPMPRRSTSSPPSQPVASA